MIIKLAVSPNSNREGTHQHSFVTTVYTLVYHTPRKYKNNRKSAIETNSSVREKMKVFTAVTLVVFLGFLEVALCYPRPASRPQGRTQGEYGRPNEVHRILLMQNPFEGDSK